LPFVEEKIGLTWLLGKDFLFELWLSKLFGVKHIHLPIGCLEDESKANFMKLDDGNVCGNCGYWDRCSDDLNHLRFSIIRRYFDIHIGIGSIDSTQYQMTHMKYKSIDLSLWNPELQIPPDHQLPKTNTLRILHSSYLENSSRNWRGRNIKGSPYVLAAIERLKAEGHPVEYFYITDKPSSQMRFYQAQADIVVEQLIYGWWGSTGVETMALGKPVVCYIRPSWKEFFLKTFPEYKDLPIVEADTNTIYDALKKLVTDPDYRRRKGEESRKFSKAHFDPEKNTRDFVKILNAVLKQN
jgi:glycosyltransferase involved in cell wall biosynthesis